MFVDESTITVAAGKGGDGATSFRREKYIARGGPSGGDGGRGGHIILKAADNLQTLHDLGSRRAFKARPGRPGGSNQRTGADGEDLMLLVPAGTLVKDAATGELLKDLDRDGETFIAARGGKGGLGNARFKTPTNRAPRRSTPGGAGEARELRLELKLLADCGLVGFPNAGKSSLLRRCSAAMPKIGDFPFTTVKPVLGVVNVGPGQSYVMVDVPGLVEGAAQGKGLGHRFLRHIERAACLAFVLDLGAGDTARRYRELLRELREFHPLLLDKPRLVVLNKSDLCPADAAAAVPEAGVKVVRTSAVTGEGVAELKQEAWRLVQESRPKSKDPWLAR